MTDAKHLATYLSRQRPKQKLTRQMKVLWLFALLPCTLMTLAVLLCGQQPIPEPSSNTFDPFSQLP
jgi:hypothetical protein